MPLFIKNKIVQIHIPKTGGSTISGYFKSIGDCCFNNTRQVLVNDHSPQHCTYKELKQLGLIPGDFKIITTIRHPYDRFMSDYNYARTHGLIGEMSLEDYAIDFSIVMDGYYDNHNLSMFEFLEDDGIIPEEIIIIKIEDIVESMKNLFDIDIVKRERVSRKFVTELPDNVKEIINGDHNWGKDFEVFGYQK